MLIVLFFFMETMQTLFFANIFLTIVFSLIGHQSTKILETYMMIFCFIIFHFIIPLFYNTTCSSFNNLSSFNLFIFSSSMNSIKINVFFFSVFVVKIGKISYSSLVLLSSSSSVLSEQLLFSSGVYALIEQLNILSTFCRTSSSGIPVHF